MLRLMLVLFVLATASPILAACTAQHPPQVPILTEPGKTKTCPGGGTNC
jgi:hypothetical protein